MYCPFCQHRDTRVLESRLTDESSSVRRRRECESCRKRFTTYERVESVALLVVKSSGAREPYSRDKLRAGVSTACAKTDLTAPELDELLDDLELELQSTGKKEIHSKVLGELVLERLKDLNEVAYVRFASVYRQFQSVDDFILVLQKLKAEQPKQAAGT